jgi:hypothetical protein
VIQAVTTYKSLQPFVSTTLLSRLISKKVWETGPLWEGFIRCAKVIAPHSFAALLQLPKEQLKDVVTKQPSMRAPLRDYVNKSEFSARELLREMRGIGADEGYFPGAQRQVPRAGVRHCWRSWEGTKRKLQHRRGRCRRKEGKTRPRRRRRREREGWWWRSGHEQKKVKYLCISPFVFIMHNSYVTLVPSCELDVERLDRAVGSAAHDLVVPTPND